MKCPHCDRDLSAMQTLGLPDMSGCPIDPPCPPKVKFDPSSAWPIPDCDDDGSVEMIPTTPKEGQAA